MALFIPNVRIGPDATTLFKNAVNTILCGIEDYQSDNSIRHANAIKCLVNGIVLLGKECLIKKTSKEFQPLEILASKFHPIPNSNDEIIYKYNDYMTIGFLDLAERFEFNHLQWPKGNITLLQKYIYIFEHYTPKKPKHLARQALSECLPLINALFRILDQDPQKFLGDNWKIILRDVEYFTCQKEYCDNSFDYIDWEISQLDFNKLTCIECYSSLIYQLDIENYDIDFIQGRCIACSQEYNGDDIVHLVVQGTYGNLDILSVENLASQVVFECPECNCHAYVSNNAHNICFRCCFSIEGKCEKCETDLSIKNYSVDIPTYCHPCELNFCD